MFFTSRRHDATLDHAGAGGRTMIVIESDGRISHADRADHAFRGRLAVFLVPGYRETFHWLMQALPRLHTLVKSGEPFDAIHVSDISRQQREALQLAMRKIGIADERLLYIPGGETVAPDLLVDAPVLWRPIHGRDPDALAEVVAFLRSLVEPDLCPVFERILVSRKGFSRYEQTAKIEALLGNFTTVAEPHRMTFYEQVNMFASARVVVGAHGSGLTNIVFGRAAKLIEIFGRRKDETSMFKWLAEAAGCSYMRYGA